MFIYVINVGKRSVACHYGSDWQVLSRSDAVISQPLCSPLQVSEMMLALIGGLQTDMCRSIIYLDNNNRHTSKCLFYTFTHKEINKVM